MSSVLLTEFIGELSCKREKEPTSQLIINRSDELIKDAGTGLVTCAKRREKVVPGNLHRGRGGERDAWSAQMVLDPRAAVFFWVFFPSLSLCRLPLAASLPVQESKSGAAGSRCKPEDLFYSWPPRGSLRSAQAQTAAAKFNSKAG